MFAYGFELEGFAIKGENVVLPPPHWTLDGFPGLVELRTFGGQSLENCWTDILRRSMDLKSKEPIKVTYQKHEHSFSGKEIAELRRGYKFRKDSIDVQNIYGKEPRRLGNKTIASLQINISNRLEAERNREIERKDGVRETIPFPARYGLLDVAGIIRRLDKAFEEDIRRSGRQPGMFCIKDGIRLEYRSLPNFSFPFDLSQAEKFFNTVRKAVEG